MSTVEIVTLVIAGYGAVLSTINTVLRIKSKQAQVDVDLKLGMLGPVAGRMSEPQLILTARNTGETTVNVGLPRFRLPDGRTMVFPGGDMHSVVDYPYELQARTKCEAWVDPHLVAAKLRSEGYSGEVDLVALFPDATQNEHDSDPVPFPINDWT